MYMHGIFKQEIPGPGNSYNPDLTYYVFTNNVGCSKSDKPCFAKTLFILNDENYKTFMGISETSQVGGFDYNHNNNYKLKYLKYKQKYLKLKQLNK